MEETGNCPVCQGRGQAVKITTVRNLVLPTLIDRVDEGQYYLCTSSMCVVAYFSKESFFNQKQVKVPIWYKQGATPKYICYCSLVTEEQIISAINEGARTLKEVVQQTGAMANSACEAKNPSGRCCADAIQCIITETLKKTK